MKAKTYGELRTYCIKEKGILRELTEVDLREAQAEISFKAGIKEVVEWEKEICSDRSHHPSEYMEKRYCNVCRMFKLAEWGVE